MPLLALAVHAIHQGVHEPHHFLRGEITAESGTQQPTVTARQRSGSVAPVMWCEGDDRVGSCVITTDYSELGIVLTSCVIWLFSNGTGQRVAVYVVDKQWHPSLLPKQRCAHDAQPPVGNEIKLHRSRPK